MRQLKSIIHQKMLNKIKIRLLINKIKINYYFKLKKIKNKKIVSKFNSKNKILQRIK